MKKIVDLPDGYIPDFLSGIWPHINSASFRISRFRLDIHPFIWYPVGYKVSYTAFARHPSEPCYSKGPHTFYYERFSPAF